MNSSISGLINKVIQLEKKTNRYLKTLRELEKQTQLTAKEISSGSLNAVHSLKTIQIKIRLIRQRYFEKTYLLENLNQKIIQLKADELFFTAEDVEGFEMALNKNDAKELQVDQLNPLFSNLSFLRVLRTQLEDYEIFEKCALLQKQINKLNVD